MRSSYIRGIYSYCLERFLELSYRILYLPLLNQGAEWTQGAKPHGPALRFVKVARSAPTTVLPFAFSKSACARRHKRLAAFNTAPPAVVSMIVRLRPSVGDGVIFTYFRRSSGRKFLPMVVRSRSRRSARLLTETPPCSPRSARIANCVVRSPVGASLPS